MTGFTRIPDNQISVVKSKAISDSDFEAVLSVADSEHEFVLELVGGALNELRATASKKDVTELKNLTITFRATS